MRHKHNLKKVFTSIDLDKDYYYLCINCGYCFSKEQIDGYLMKDWRNQSIIFANSDIKVNEQTLKDLKEWREKNDKKKLV